MLDALIMPDATVLSTFLTNNTNKNPTVCVEIKPKFGAIHLCSTIHPDNAPLKQSTSRYQLHQHLKLHQGNIDLISKYDPLDLFSNDSERIHHALHALLNNPQNNLVLFIDGQKVDIIQSNSITSVQDVLLPHMSISKLVYILRSILIQEGILDTLLDVQQLCRMDIEGIHYIYQHILQQKPSLDITCQQHIGLESLNTLSHDDAYSLLRKYCIATTAKDCSIMLTFQKQATQCGLCGKKQGSDFSEHGILVSLDNEHFHTNELYAYRVTVVDVDRKSTKKIEKHYQLDTNIMHVAPMLNNQTSNVHT